MEGAIEFTTGSLMMIVAALSAILLSAMKLKEKSLEIKTLKIELNRLRDDFEDSEQARTEAEIRLKECQKAQQILLNEKDQA